MPPPEDFPLPLSCSESTVSEDRNHFDELQPLVTPAYTFSARELRDLYMASIRIRQVIAGCPITKGGSRCSYDCDTENHHVHTYCKLCKRNLPYGTSVHNCIVGFAPGQIKFDMNPDYLINEPWWTEPLAVQQENSLIYLETLLSYFYCLHFSPYTSSAIVAADLD